jgi:probable HAF family extracellular repeat protein
MKRCTLLPALGCTVVALSLHGCDYQTGPERVSGLEDAMLSATGPIPTYEIIDLGTLGGTGSDARSINARGQVVGWSRTASGAAHAFLWEKGIMTDLGTLGGAESRAHFIINRGQVVGQARVPAGPYHAFLWDKGTMIDLGTLGGAFSRAHGVNELGR